jgi:hypothetical protein
VSGWCDYPYGAFGGFLGVVHQAWDLIRRYESEDGAFPPPDIARQLCDAGLRTYAALVDSLPDSNE